MRKQILHRHPMASGLTSRFSCGVSHLSPCETARDGRKSGELTDRPADHSRESKRPFRIALKVDR
jgi:hypothetical protein